MSRWILAYDLGTTGNKVSLYSGEGKVLASALAAYQTSYGKNGEAEQDPEDWWRAVVSATQEIVAKYECRNIACLSFSGQMMGLVCVDRAGRPLRNSLIHCDQRATKQNDRLLEKITDADFYQITGHKASPSYPLQKLMWVKENEPEIYKNTYKVINAKDFIVFRLTGNLMTDYTDATSTNMFDISRRTWSDKLLSLAQLDADKLPEVKPSTHVAGFLCEGAAGQLGLKKDIPVVLGAGDGMCASIGCGAVRPGKAYNYIGSSAWITSITGKPVFDKQMRLETWAHPDSRYSNVGGTMQTAGACYAWAVRQLYGTQENPEIAAELSQTRPGSGGILFLPYLQGERVPFWNPDARGVFLGLSTTSTRADMLRAVLEGVAFNLKTILNVFQTHIPIAELTLIGGGANNELWTQMMADIYNVPILKPKNLSGVTSVGAAIIGGVGAGIFESFDVAEDFLEIDSRQVPDPDNKEIYDRLHEVFLKSYESLVDVFKLLRDNRKSGG